MRLPPTVKDAKPMIMMFIDHNPQLQHASPETVIDNIVQFATEFYQVNGKMLNLTMDQQEAIPMPPRKMEEPRKMGEERKMIAVERMKAFKMSPKIHEMDTDIEAELEKQRKKLLMARTIAQKKAELRRLEEEDVPESE
jgi:uncharacterized protein (DUF849 family)